MPQRPFLILLLACILSLPSRSFSDELRAPRLDQFGDPLPAGSVARLGTLRFHRSDSTAFSPNGKLIATANSEELTLWDAKTFARIRTIPNPNSWSPEGLFFSHDGKKICGIRWGGSAAIVWNLETSLATGFDLADGASGGGDWSSAAAFSADGKTLFAATSRRIFVCNVDSGKILQEHPFVRGEKAVAVRMVTFAENGKIVATQGEGKVHLWDSQSGAVIRELDVLGGAETMKFSPDGKRLVIPSYGRWLRIFDVESGKKLSAVVVSERVLSLAFSANGKTLAVASNATIWSSSTSGDQVIQIFDTENLQRKASKLQAPGVESVRVSPDGKTLAWKCHGHTVRFMDRATGKELNPADSHSGTINAIVFLPDGKRIASAGADGTIRIWDAESGKSLRVLEGHKCAIDGLALYPNGRWLTSCGRDGTFRIWDLDRAKPVVALRDEGNSVVAAAFSADGKHLASGGNRGLTFLRDPATGRILEEFETGSVRSLSLTPDGKTLAALSYSDPKLHLIDLSTKKMKEVPLERGPSSVAYSPDGKILAVACDERMLIVDAVSHRTLRMLPGHFNRRGCVKFSPDGRYLASVSDGYGEFANRTIRVFEVATWAEIYSFKKDVPMLACAFSPDGAKLVIGGEDATALVLDFKNLSGKKRRERLNEGELAANWEAFEVQEASLAYEARCELLHSVENTTQFLAKHLSPVPPVGAKQVDAWIKSLNSDQFRVRDRAARELEQLGELVREPMKRALSAKPTAEVRQRLEMLLGKLEQLTPIQLRQIRAIEILETIGTPEAEAIIGHLAKGNADGLLTRECRNAIARRQARKAPLPPDPVARTTSELPIPSLGPVRLDLDGDPMPAGAVARLGSARWHTASEPRRILVSPDGKKLAVVNLHSSLESFDAKTGKNIRLAEGGFSGLWFDLRNSVGLTRDWRKSAAIESNEPGESVLVVLDATTKQKVRISYRRNEESHPVIPEEIESAGSISSSTAEYLSAAEFSLDGGTLFGSVRFEWRCSSEKLKHELKETHLVAWDATTGKELWKRLVDAREINTILCSGSPKSLIVVDREGVSLCDTATGREIRRWPSKDSLFSARLSPDGRWLATGSKEAVILWDVETGKVRHRLAIQAPKVLAVAFRPDGKRLAAGSEKSLRIWDPANGKLLGESSSFPNSIQTIAYAGDGKLIYSGHDEEHVLRRWDAETLRLAEQIKGPLTPVELLAFAPDGRKILAASTNNFDLWQAKTGKLESRSIIGSERMVVQLLASIAQAELRTCQNLLLWKFARLLKRQDNHVEPLPNFIAASTNGKRLLVRSRKDNQTCLTVVKSPSNLTTEFLQDKDRILREFTFSDEDDIRAGLSPDGQSVAVTMKNSLSFFDVKTGQKRQFDLPVPSNPTTTIRLETVKYSPDGSRIAVMDAEGQIRVVSVKDGRVLAEISVRRSRVSDLALSPDGQTLLTGSFSGPVRVWEIASGQLIRQLPPGNYCFSPDNRLLSGDSDTLVLFDFYSNRPIGECRIPGQTQGGSVFSPDSKRMAVCSSDTTVLIFPTVPAEAHIGVPFDEKRAIESLEKGTSDEAYLAIGQMIAQPERTSKLLELKLRPAAGIEVKLLDRLFAELRSRESARRDTAVRELARLGPLGVPALKSALGRDKLPADTRQLIESVLKQWNETPTSLTPDELLHVRAIQVLERIGTRRAEELLEKISLGAEGSPRTQAAIEARARFNANAERPRETK